MKRKAPKKPGHYRDNAGKWRWRTVGANHEVTGASSQGFATRKISRENARLVREALAVLR